MTRLPTGRVESLHLYPVKGLRGLSLEQAEVAAAGLDGDRRWLVTDTADRFLTQRQLADMARLDALPTPDGLLLRQDGRAHAVSRPPPDGDGVSVTVWGDVVRAVRASDDAAAWLSTALGQPCRLAYMADAGARPVDPDFGQPGDHVGFADGFPLLAASLGSLASLNGALARPVGIERFRANVVLSGLPPWSEDRWSRVRIGAMRFRAPRPCTRCVVITRDQRTGDTPDPGEPLRTLGRLNRHAAGIVFGANLIPEAPGRLSVGDAVEVLETLPAKRD